MGAWAVGRIIVLKGLISWELIGVFSSELKAVAVCVDGTYFVAPLEIDEIIPEATKWKGMYHPKGSRRRAD